MSAFRACANWTGGSAARDKGKPLLWEPVAARNVRGLGVATLPFGLTVFCLTADLQIRAKTALPSRVKPKPGAGAD